MGSMSPPATLKAESLHRLKNKRVKVFLVTGMPMTGRLLAYDDHSLALSNEDPDKEHLLINYKNVCTVLPE